jgi:hypothetical protein
MAVNISFNSRYAEAKVWPDRNYIYVFLGGEPGFETADRHMIDSRVNFAHQAFSTAQSMTLELVGAGSKYFAGAKDGSGAWLNGSNTYRIRLSKDVPARNFWSLMVYDTGTRSMIDNEHGIPGLGGGDDLKRNKDGTVDLYMGPSAPAGMESNWVRRPNLSSVHRSREAVWPRVHARLFEACPSAAQFIDARKLVRSPSSGLRVPSQVRN